MKLERPLIFIIKLYRRYVSPAFPPTCRFTPSCSRYALIAIETHGALTGSLLALRRVLRCHPFSEGGYDPVPPKIKRNKRDAEDAVPYKRVGR